MKKGDYIVLALILLLSTGIFLSSRNTLADTNKKQVVVSVNGKVEGRYTLSDIPKTYVVKNEYGVNSFTITSDGVHMTESDCKDKVCLHMGHITRVGESVICLPNRLVIALEKADGLGEDKNDIEVDVVLH